jgi:serine/threonine protein kinase
MSAQLRYKVGETIAGWQLSQLLGVGGNGEVWRATRSHSAVAFKILKNTRPDSEPYKRFINEVRVLQQLGQRRGILPLLEVHLPTSPSKIDPAWLTTPVAVPIQAALPAEAPLLTAVQAVHSISATLAELAATRALNHRDIKPENLYLYDAQWCIGDFGLVDDPIGEPITEVGKLLGARHYLAPELYRPDNCSWSSADLYALAKTLWVLITAQRYPPPGHLVRNVDHFCLSTHIQANDSVRYLERLIERSTDPDPKARPSMKDFSQELELWLSPRDPPVPTAASEAVRERIRSTVASTQDTESRRKQLRSYVDGRLASLHTEFRTLGSVIESLTGLKPEYGIFPELQSSNHVTQLSHLPDTYYVGMVSSRIAAPLKRCSGFATHVAAIVLCVTTSSELHMVALHLLTASPKALVLHHWIKNASAPMDSLFEQHSLTDLLTTLRAKLPEALETFAQLIES